MLLKLQCDGTLSNFALNFNMRRYTQVIDNGDGTYVANFVLYKIGTYTARAGHCSTCHLNLTYFCHSYRGDALLQSATCKSEYQARALAPSLNTGCTIRTANKPPIVSHKDGPRRAEKWRSVCPWHTVRPRLASVGITPTTFSVTAGQLHVASTMLNGGALQV